jgi:hypothetical protein
MARKFVVYGRTVEKSGASKVVAYGRTFESTVTGGATARSQQRQASYSVTGNTTNLLQTGY